MAARNLEKMASIDAQLRLLAPGKVSEDDKLVEYDALLLDRFLDILQDLHGEEIRETVQECYELSAEYEGKRDPKKLDELGNVLTSLDPGDSIVVTKSFSHMLSLANLAEEVQIAYRRRIKLKKGDFADEASATTESDIEETIKRLVGQLKKSPEEIFDALKNQTVDLVLTAHPTQSVRRSLLQKHARIRNCLTQLNAKDITPDDKQELDEALQREIQAAFRTDEIRRTPPTPQDEMRAGMSYFHETIWKGVPKFLRRVDTALKNIGVKMTKPSCLVVLLYAVSLALSPSAVSAQQCGSQAGGAKCAGGLCCSKFGYCGSTQAYCGDGCQSQCTTGSTPTPNPPTGGGGGGDISGIISRDLFEQMLKHRNDAACPAKGFYTYDAFIAAAKSFGGFGTTGDVATRKREIAAFLGQTSHETTGGWPTAPDGPYSWGYCFKQEQGNPGDYCVANQQWPCAPGKKYYGRGPIQISYNYNYGPAGRAINYDLLRDPDAVANDPTISFKTALWFWMTPQSPKPSCHSVITGQWTPSSADNAAGRVPGYGVITNIINGGIECGKPTPSQVQDRIGFYKRYCDLLGVSYGNNLDCANQRPFS